MDQPPSLFLSSVKLLVDPSVRVKFLLTIQHIEFSDACGES